MKNFNYYIIKLKFITPVHFGSDNMGVGLESTSMCCRADTLFSAMCNEIISIYNEDEVNYFKDLVDREEILFSDLFPYKEDKYYIPKPIISIKNSNSQRKTDDKTNNRIKKKMKNLNYIQIDKIEEYKKSIKTGTEYLYDEKDYEFGIDSKSQRVFVTRKSDEDSEPYQVGSFSFNENSGLYFIVSVSGEDILDFIKEILTALSFSGIGGKRSSGYGKFNEIDNSIQKIDENNFENFYKYLQTKEANYYMNLSGIIPDDKDFEQLKVDKEKIFYKLVQRNGFVYSKTYASTFYKKQPITLIDTGSCFTNKLKGKVENVKKNGTHNVYRYGKGLYLCLKF